MVGRWVWAATAAGTCVLCVLGLGAGSGTAVSGWKLTDLGTAAAFRHRPAVANRPVAMNDQAEVVGSSSIPVWGGPTVSDPITIPQRAFVWRRGKLTDLGRGSVNAINDRGQVIGVSDLAAAGHHHGFLWQNGKMTDIGTLGGWTSDPVAINERGQITGQSTTAKGTVHAFLGEAFVWQKGEMTDLGPLPSHPVCHHRLAVLCESMRTVARAINDQGQIVGYSVNAADNEHAFLWKSGKMNDLGTLGGISSTATAITDGGEVVGASASQANPFSEAFVWEKGKMTDLGMGGATAIDRSGNAIIGFREVGTLNPDGSFSTRGGSRALLWTGR